MKKKIFRILIVILITYGAIAGMIYILKGNVPNKCFSYEEYEDGIRITDYKCNRLRNVNIPEVIDNKKVIEIGNKAFYEKDLIIKTIPSTLKTIGASAFEENTFYDVVLPDSLTFIGKNAFSNCNMDSVVIPEGITLIPESAFEGNNLRKIIIPDSVTIIEDFAFADNEAEEVVISKNIKKIGLGAFYNLNRSNQTIINKTGQKFDWYYIVELEESDPFEFGDVYYNYIDIDDNNEEKLVLAASVVEKEKE